MSQKTLSQGKYRIKKKSIGADTTIGGPELCGWKVAPGVTWIQTRSADFARKLSRRSDGRLVACGVAGGYLRTYEFPHGLAWARRLIARYQSAGKVTNERFLTPTLAQTKVLLPDGVIQRTNRPARFSVKNRMIGVPAITGPFGGDVTMN